MDVVPVSADAVRLTAMIEPGNRRAIKNATAMGFVVEGLCRRGIDGRREVRGALIRRERPRFLEHLFQTQPVVGVEGQSR